MTLGPSFKLKQEFYLLIFGPRGCHLAIELSCFNTLSLHKSSFSEMHIPYLDIL